MTPAEMIAENENLTKWMQEQLIAQYDKGKRDLLKSLIELMKDSIEKATTVEEKIHVLCYVYTASLAEDALARLNADVVSRSEAKK